MFPLVNNILVALISVIYVFAVVAVMDYAVKKGFPQDTSRKVVHIAAGSWIIFWSFYDFSHWSKYLNIAPAFIWALLLLQKGFFAKDNDEAVRTMTRTGDKKELLKGPFYFTIVMNFMGTAFLNTPMAVTAMSFLGWGDGIAPVIGKKFGKTRYKVFCTKSLQGSIAFFLFGIFAAIVFNYILMGEVNLTVILVCGAAATIAEAISPPDLDNIFIPVVVALLYLFLI